eukprot:5455933-Amphidinium_carterae.1
MTKNANFFPDHNSDTSSNTAWKKGFNPGEGHAGCAPACTTRRRTSATWLQPLLVHSQSPPCTPARRGVSVLRASGAIKPDGKVVLSLDLTCLATTVKTLQVGLMADHTLMRTNEERHFRLNHSDGPNIQVCFQEPYQDWSNQSPEVEVFVHEVRPVAPRGIMFKSGMLSGAQ